MCSKILNVNSDGLGNASLLQFDTDAVCHEGESEIQCCGNIMSYGGHHVPLICQACSSHGELQM